MLQARGYLSNLVGKQVTIQQQYKQLTAELKALHQQQQNGSKTVGDVEVSMCSAEASRYIQYACHTDTQ
jgi:hypothetical protein